MQMLTDTFNVAATSEADESGTKRLDEAQYVDWSLKMEANFEAKTWVLPKYTPEYCKKVYAVVNKLNSSNGVSLMDILNQLSKRKEIYDKLRAAKN